VRRSKCNPFTRVLRDRINPSGVTIDNIEMPLLLFKDRTLRSGKAVPLILLFFFIAACVSPKIEYTDLEPRTIPIEDVESISIRGGRGDVSIIGTDDQRLQINGQVQVPNESSLQIVSSEKLIEVSLTGRDGALAQKLARLEIRIPYRLKVNIETDSADVHVQEFKGELEIESTSGDILVESSNGKITLRSNRGDVTVQKSSGTISVVGNYGQLKVQDVKGETAVSTIMGTITLNGLLGEGDSARLETDHGPVDVNLGSNSSLKLVVHSTSGEVTCVVPDLSLTPRSCEGTMGIGTGALTIRTVSGAVVIRLIP
jgi:DUF4097 and DUF4098 domain-containing protein YvlB